MHISHHDGGKHRGGAAGRDAFCYVFEEAARDPSCLLPVGHGTVNALLDLGAAMGDPGGRTERVGHGAGAMPAVMTSFARFIAHDLMSPLGGMAGTDLIPLAPDEVARKTANLRNGRFDLASLFGDDGPAGGVAGCPWEVGAGSHELYEGLRLKVSFDRDGRLDLPRHRTGPQAGRAIVGDSRNDGDLLLSQFHAAWLRFHNVVFESTLGASPQTRWSQTRRLVRWTYQYLVVNAFLPAVCDAAVLADVRCRGARFFRPALDRSSLPLEFVLAALPFADAAARPEYTLNDRRTVSHDAVSAPVAGMLDTDGMLCDEAIVSWGRFVEIDGAGTAQRATAIGPRLASGLGARTETVRQMTARTQRRLLRGYLSSLPTGQAVAARMGYDPMGALDILGTDPVLAQALRAGGFEESTPLWFYVLREAELIGGAKTLGPVGSRLLAESVLGLLNADSESYLNHATNKAVSPTGIEISSGFSTTTIGSLADLVRYAGLRR